MNTALQIPFATSLGNFFRQRRPAVAGAASAMRAAEPMAKGAVLAVPAGTTATISCVTGDLWITYDSDPRDVMVAAGESHTSHGTARMLVYALESSIVIVH
jgi:hypothetical protein